MGKFLWIVVMIDIYVATVPKRCGILNKVLYAFSHKVLTLGAKESFTAFYELENVYLIVIPYRIL